MCFFARLAKKFINHEQKNDVFRLVHEPEGWSVPYWGANSNQYFWIPRDLSFNLIGDSNAGVVA